MFIPYFVHTFIAQILEERVLTLYYLEKPKFVLLFSVSKSFF